MPAADGPHPVGAIGVFAVLNVDPLGLDDRVLDLVRNLGSEINNGRLVVQIEYLLDEIGEAETEQEIRRAAADQRRRDSGTATMTSTGGQ